MRSVRMPAIASGTLVCAIVVGVVAVLALGGGGGKRLVHAGQPNEGSDPSARSLLPRPRAVEPDVGAPVVAEVPQVDAEISPPRDPEAHLAQPPASGPGSGISPGAPTDAEVRAELRDIQGSGNGQARVLATGEAVAPAGAPLVVKQIIAAGNAIARTPYLWGGGHARLYDRGYDCSGSLSFTFIHAGLLAAPIAQGWSTMGQPGAGRWISIYSDAGHVFMVVAGLRFDTSAIHLAGSRWTQQSRPTTGFTVRHLPGL